MRTPFLLLAVLFASLPAPGPVRAETVNCISITSLPATISTQGVYCLKQDLATAIGSGNAISINTNNVTLDCNHFKVGGLAAGLATQAKGISASARANIVVRNCNVRGFRTGISLGGSGHVVESNRLDGNLQHGILVQGENSTVRGNRVFDTGGVDVASRGIETSGAVDIIDNTVSGVETADGSGFAATGILALSSPGGSVKGNIVRGVTGDNGAFAIALAYSPKVSVRQNVMFSPSHLLGNNGVFCFSGASVVADNSILGFTAAAQGCSPHGANLIM